MYESNSMKAFFRILCILLLFPVGVAFAAFSDVPAGSQYDTALSFLQEKGVIQGYPDGTFRPNQSVNRAEVLKMLYEGYKRSPQDANASPFPDVSRGQWFTKYVDDAFQRGYVQGYPDGEFRPGDQVKVVEVMKILVTIGEKATYTKTSPLYEEYELDTAQWYAPYVLFAQSRQLTDFLRTSDIPLDTPATRGLVAEMLYRILYIEQEGLETFPNYRSGVVSYYADSFNGKSTASGETFSNSLYSTAHPGFGFGTWLQVASDETLESVLVRVNDRGPFRDSGLVDLTKKAFGVLHPTSKGIFDGRAYKVGFTTSKIEKKEYAELGGIELQRAFPSMFVPGELHVLVGTAPSGADVSARIKRGTSTVYTASDTASGNRVEIPLFFEEAGDFTLEIDVEGQKTSIPVWVRSLESRSLSPTQVSGTVAASWDGNDIALELDVVGDYVYRILVEQGSKSQLFTLPFEKEVTLPTARLGFRDSSEVLISVKASKSSTVFAHDAYTTWKQVAVSRLTADGSADNSLPSNILGDTSDPGLVQVADEGVELDIPAEVRADMEQILAWVNVDRDAVGAPRLKLSDSLSQLAFHKAVDMAKRDYFAHEDPEGKFVNDWKDIYGYTSLVAENIGFATKYDIEAVYEGWRQSPGHYANIIDPKNTLLGVGLAQGVDRKYYYVQHFSNPSFDASDSSLFIINAIKELNRDGRAATRSLELEAVAKNWATYLAEIKDLSFSVNGQSIFEILREEVGAGSYKAYVFALTSTSELLPLLRDNISVTGSFELGMGIVQDADGWLRVGVITKQ